MTNKEFENKLLFFQQLTGTLRGLTRELAPEAVSWDADAMELTMAFHTNEDMTNPVGNLHGGVIATIFDNGMGVLAACFADGAFTPTISMNLEYLRPVPLTKTVFLHAKIVKRGRSMIHLRSELMDAPSGGKVYAAATSIFAIHATQKFSIDS